jgi:hypothetical protein
MLQTNRDLLKELFIVSDVDILPDSAVDELRTRVNGASEFDIDGQFGRISTTPSAILLGRRAGGRKCQRCWCYYDDDGHPELCPRCRAVVAGLSQ